MPKPSLTPELEELERQIIQTLIAGHKQWRPDLAYPESYSDMQGAVRGLLRMFEVKLRPLPESLRTPCIECGGSGLLVQTDRTRIKCAKCGSRGWNPI